MDDPTSTHDKTPAANRELALLLLRNELIHRFPHTLDPKIKGVYDQLVEEADAIAQLHMGFMAATLDTQKMLAELALSLPTFLLLTPEQLPFLQALSAAAHRFYIVPWQETRGIRIHAYFPCFRQVPVDQVPFTTLLMLARDIARQHHLVLTEDDLKEGIDAACRILREKEAAAGGEA